MSAENEPVLMRRDYLDVTEDRDPERAVAWLREANEYLDARNPVRDDGMVWSFQTGPERENSEALEVGIRGDRGWLEWLYGDQDLIPADGGLNDEWVHYWTCLGDDAGGAPPGSELPIDRVYELVAEFVRTATRPTSIQWRPVEYESTS